MTVLMTEKSPASFRSYFIDKIMHADNPYIDSRVAHHTDLSVFSFGDTVVCAPFIFGFLSEKLEGTEVICGEKPFSPYPDEVMYNAVLVGRKLFCNVKHTSAAVLCEAEKRGIKPVSVPQGYTKCSTIPVTDGAVITSDISVARAAEKEGLDVLHVSNRGVLLSGFDCGFIGGTAVNTGDEIVFTGDLSTVPDGVRISDFIESYGKKTVSFPGEPLLDIGSPAVIFR